MCEIYRTRSVSGALVIGAIRQHIMILKLYKKLCWKIRGIFKSDKRTEVFFGNVISWMEYLSEQISGLIL